ncbi:uri1, prefoldin-like chaperone [Coemansia sp. RSA 988]|nr:uri1, prefoldin-like chaperone [Coemansia sp. RSA 988]
MNKKESAQQRRQQPQGSTGTHAKNLEQNKLSLESALRQYDEYKEEYKGLQQTLRELPNEVEYDAMVPVGPLAFFPGKIIDTNEILVLLGDNWFVTRSAKEAADISKRREDFVDTKVVALRKELEDLNKRKELAASNFDIAQVLGAEIGGDIVNEEGEKVIDIKEELEEGQLPSFSTPTNATADKATELSADVAVSLKEKRERMISSLSAGDKIEEAPLGSEERKIMDMLYQLEQEEQAYEEEESLDEDSISDRIESDEGDEFSDEDRMNAAQDDDDDFNDEFKLKVVENTNRSSPDTSRDMTPPAPKGILKSSAATSLFKDRATKARSGNERKKSVGFHSTAVSYSKASNNLLDESNEDIDGMTKLLGMLSGPSAAKTANKHTTSGVPRTSLIHEDDISRDADNTSVSIAPEEIKNQKPISVHKFKPNVDALTGARSKRQTASNSGLNKEIGSSGDDKISKKSTTKKAVHGQPLRSSVVENKPVEHDEVTQDMVDEDMHAREIAQAYNRMRFARISTGQLDGAAETAEKILSEIPCVALIEPRTDHIDDNDEYERIEIPEEPSQFALAVDNSNPPEVIHKPRRAPVLAQPAISSSVPAGESSHVQPPQVKPKISRFKARRLGLDNSEA